MSDKKEIEPPSEDLSTCEKKTELQSEEKLAYKQKIEQNSKDEPADKKETELKTQDKKEIYQETKSEDIRDNKESEPETENKNKHGEKNETGTKLNDDLKCDQDFWNSSDNQLSNGIEAKGSEVTAAKMLLESTRGKGTTTDIVDMLQTGEGLRVLEMGCGNGTSAIFIAKTCKGARVIAVDISSKLISHAKKQLEMEDTIKDNVDFQVGDIMEIEFEDNSFDYIYSREVTIYISDKELLFSKIFKWLKPGGRLLMSDYCLGKDHESENFQNYVKKQDYHMKSIEELETILSKVGFKDIKAEDKTLNCLEILQTDLDAFLRDKHKLLNTITRCEYDTIVTLWEDKLKSCKNGEQAWGIFVGTK